MRQILRSVSSTTISRTWFAVVCAVAIMIALAPIATHADQLSGTYVGSGQGQRVTFERNDEERNAWAGTLRFQLDDGEELKVFCIQLDVRIRGNAPYQGSGSVIELHNGCQIRYILDKYPGSSVSDPLEGSARQMAVWHFSDDVDLTTIIDDQAEVRDRAIAIADEAAASSCPARRTEPPELRIESDTTTLNVGSRLEYRVIADNMDAGQPFTATLSGPVTFDDGSQQMITTMDGSGTAVLGVTSTEVGTSTIHVLLPYRLEAGVVFAAGDGEPSQRLVMAQRLEREAEADAVTVWDEEDTPTPTLTPEVPTETVVPTETEAVVTSTPEAPTETPQAEVTPEVTEVGPTPTDTAAPAPTPYSTPEREMPKDFPKTGGGPTPMWPALVVAGLLLAVGLLLKR